MPNNIETLYAGKYLSMVRRHTWEFVQRHNIAGIVGILAITDAGNMLFVEQHRIPLGKDVIEIPAGIAGDTDAFRHEDLATAAHRELEEETGYRAEKMTLLCSGATSSGLTDEIVTLYRATGLTKVGPGGGDHSENIRVHEIPLAQVPAWLASQQSAGKAIDLKVYSALFFTQSDPTLIL